ncbi:MAG: hypothetical protein NTV86_06495 [Planctomycetota bacterium]|nr:hypothetical protein [Planctomycetota bacterium]
MSVFAGITGLVLAVIGACRADKATRRFFALTAAILLVLATGSHLPLFRLLYAAVPGYDKFRGTSKFALLATIFIAMLSGMGLDVLLKKGKAGLGTLGPLAAGAAGLALAAMGVNSSCQSPVGLWARFMQAVAGTREVYAPAESYRDAGFVARAGEFAAQSLLLAAGTMALLALLLWLARRCTKVVFVVAALAIAEVFAFAAVSRDTFPLSAIRSDEIQRLLSRQPGDYRIMHLSRPNAAIGEGAYDAGGYEPGAARERYADFVAFTQGMDLNQVDDFPHITRPHPLFALMRCRFVFIPTAEGLKLDPLETPPLPHLLLVQDVRVVTGGREAVLGAMGQPNFNPATTAILESPPDPMPVADSSRPGAVTLVDSTVNSLTIEADLPAPALLVITDAYAKGWRAVPLPGSTQSSYHVMPADYAFRAVPLSAGKHRFRVEYAPAGFAAGKWISLASLAAFLGACAWLWTAPLRKRPVTGESDLPSAHLA